VDACVHDGLACINAGTERSSIDRRLAGFSIRTHSIELLDCAQVQDLKLPNKQESCIQQKNLIIQAACRSFPTDIALKSSIREPAFFINALLKIIDGKQSLLGDAQVGGLLSQIEIFPYKRNSIKIGELSDSECKNFLREAEAIKGIPAGRAELLAVFRHIPIEMISKMRYLAGNRIIFYTICRGINRNQTRVHDMAAIRDVVSRNIFLIPHRTRFRSVHLN
jgi:hypothetical protein